MMLHSSAIKLVALAASLLAAAPLASAELRQGPTGVKYVKRFAASPGVDGCYYTCPKTYTRSPEGLRTVPLLDPPEGLDYGNDITLCRYYDGGASPILVECYYTADGQFRSAGSGVFGSPASGETLNCPTSADRSLSCPNDEKRELSALEKVVKSRQYDPKRAKRRSTRRW